MAILLILSDFLKNKDDYDGKVPLFSFI